MHTLWAIPAIYLAYRIARIACRRPHLAVFVGAAAAMAVPVILLEWAQVPKLVAIVPMLIMLGCILCSLGSSALDVVHTPRRGRRQPETRQGFWTAPLRASGEHHGEGGVAAAFTDIINRNFRAS